MGVLLMLNNANIIKRLLVICLAIIVLLLYNFFKNDYYIQDVNLERMENIQLEGDLQSIQDFRPEGMDVYWKRHEIDFEGKPAKLKETISIDKLSSRISVSMDLYRNREDAANAFKESRIGCTQTKKIIDYNDAYVISKVRRLRDSDFGGIFKLESYYSEVLFIKNNLVVSISSYNNDKSGSSKQYMIDTIGDYLEKLAAKEKKL